MRVPAFRCRTWRLSGALLFLFEPLAREYENPAGQEVFRYGLRFPGQHFDAETGTHYNYFRDYDPAIGRYLQSDPPGCDEERNERTRAEVEALGVRSLAVQVDLTDRAANRGKITTSAASFRFLGRKSSLPMARPRERSCSPPARWRSSSRPTASRSA